MHTVIETASDRALLRLTETDEAGAVLDVREIPRAELPSVVREERYRTTRWVFGSTRERYPELLSAGVRLARSHDLTLCRTILRRSTRTAGTALHGAPLDAWDAAPDAAVSAEGMLEGLDLLEAGAGGAPDAVLELRRQLACVAESSDPGRLRLLLAAESCGALIACEIHHDGLPWDRAEHERLLEEALGPRPRFGGRPARMEELLSRIRGLLGTPSLNPDSQQELLRALKRAGLPVTSTSKWELREVEHPVVEPLLRYKSLSRLLTANGWAWLDEWVHDGRFRPEYVVGGVVTGRWASSGGGALQLPVQVRPAVIADPGWTFVVADAAQLEPRIVAAMAGDAAMASAGRGRDLYAGFVDAGVVDTRAHAKIAMLGALYGSTTGESARLMPRLMRAFPRAIGLVEAAARAGERGEQVTTWLGRSSPPPSEGWTAAQESASLPDASADEVSRARRIGRDWGRFTRNFVAQGTAAEWALCWMAELRHRLSALEDGSGLPHLVYFLHDEVVVHSPIPLAEAVSDAVRDAAARAGRGLFGGFPVDFPLDVTITRRYSDAKG